MTTASPPSPSVPRRPRRPRRALVAGVIRAVCLAAATALVAGSLASGDLRSAPSPRLTPAAETYPVGTSGTVTLTGHGFGHGHGMSQYGAYGAAAAGIPWTTIVDHYYPGTTRTAIGNPTIRVDVRSDLGRMAFGAGAGLVATFGPERAGATTLPVTGGDGSAVVAFVASAASATTLRLVYLTAAGGAGTVGVPSSQVNVTNPRTGVVSAWGSASGRVGTIRGEFRGVMVSGAVVPVAAVPLDEYLRGVVPHESPASWPAAALQAQAVAARSYAAYAMAHPRSPAYDICDSTACQVFEARGYYASTDAAVTTTAGVVMSYRGAAAFTEFSSSTGGWNSAGSQPYLVAQPDPWDGTTANPYRSWSVPVTAATWQANWPTIGAYRSLTVLARDGAGEWGGRILSVSLQGTAGAVTVSGETLRARLGLKSTYFTVAVTVDDLVGAVPSGSSGRLEVDVATGVSGYVAPPTRTVTGIAATSPTRSRVVLGRDSDGRRPDVLSVQASGTASGRVEVVTASSASGYAGASRAITPLTGFTPDAGIQVTAGRLPGDVCFVFLTGTGSGRLELHCLSASSGYTQWSLHAATAIGAGLSAAGNRFLLSPGSGDLSWIAHSTGTGSGRSELHRLSAASGYHTWTVHAALPLGYTSDASSAWSLRTVSTSTSPDLAWVALSGTGSGKVEVHVVSAASSYTAWSVHAATGQPTTAYPVYQPTFG